MKFDLFGFSFNKLSQFISALSFMFNGKYPDGTSVPGRTRHLLFIAHDPIGWRLQLLYFILPTGYEAKYVQYMTSLRNNFGHGKPIKTGGVKPEGKVVPLVPDPAPN